MSVTLPQRGGARRDDRRGARLDLACAADVRAHRRHRQLLLPRPVVPEDWRARGRRMEHPPVPRGHGVLLRLRRLRRAASPSRAAGSSARRASSAAPRRQPTGKTTHRFVQEDVHDFAWTTSPDCVERTRAVRTAGAAARGHAAAAPAGARGQADRHFVATRATLRSYGEWFGPYPYGHITIVDPAWQSGAGGMEYPTLFTAGTRWLVRDGVTKPEGVTVHECGPPVLVRNRRQQRVRARLDGRRPEHVFDGARARSAFRPHFESDAVLRRTSCRGCTATSRSRARPTTTGCRTFARPRRAMRPRRRRGATSLERAARSPTTRPRCG